MASTACSAIFVVPGVSCPAGHEEPRPFDINDGKFTSGGSSFAAAAAFVVLFAVLHVIKPELIPRGVWAVNTLSETTAGSCGSQCFALALSCAALFSALRPEIETTGGRIALGLLLVDAAALVVGGTFVVDPITTKPADMTTHGMTHSAAGAIFLFGFPIAGVLLGRSLERRQIWRSAVQVDSMDSPLHVDKRRDDVGPYHHEYNRAAAFSVPARGTDG